MNYITRSKHIGRGHRGSYKPNGSVFHNARSSRLSASIQAFILILMIGVLFSGFYLQPKEKNWIVEAKDSAKSIETSTIQINNNTQLKEYPEDPIDREGYIREYMATRYTPEELSNEAIENLIRIAKIESSRHDPKVEPKTTVFHCKRDGKWFVVENFTGCPEGTTPGRKEKSLGIFQILKSTWDGYKCEGDRTNADDQIRCGVKIYQKAGYKAWYLSSKKLGII